MKIVKLTEDKIIGGRLRVKGEIVLGEHNGVVIKEVNKKHGESKQNTIQNKNKKRS